MQSLLDGTIDKPREGSVDSHVQKRQVTLLPQTTYTYSAIEQQSILPTGWVYDDTPQISGSVKSILKNWGLSVILENVTKVGGRVLWGIRYKVTADVFPVNKALGSLFSDFNSMIRFHSNSGSTTQQPPFDSAPVWNSYEDGHKLWGDPTDPAAAGAHRGVFSNTAGTIKELMNIQARSIRSNSGSGSTAVPCDFVPGQSIFQSPINALHYAMAYAETHTFGNGATFCLLRVNADGGAKVIGTTITTVETRTPRPGIVEFGMATIGERPAWRPILRDTDIDEHLIDTDNFTGWGSAIITTHAGAIGENGNKRNEAPGTAQLHTDSSGGGYIIVLVPGPNMKSGAILYELYKAYDKYNPKTRSQFDLLLRYYYDFDEMSDTQRYGEFVKFGTTLAGTDIPGEDTPGEAQTLHLIRTRLFKFVSEFSEDSLRSTYIGTLTRQRNSLEDRNWVAAAKFTLTDKNESAILGEIEARKACEDIMRQLKHLPLITNLIQTSKEKNKIYGFYIEYGSATAPEIIFKKVDNNSSWFGLGTVADGEEPLRLGVNKPLKTYQVLSNGTLQEIVRRVIPADEADAETRSSLWAPLNDYIPSIEFDENVKFVLFGGGALTLVHYTFA